MPLLLCSGVLRSGSVRDRCLQCLCWPSVGRARWVTCKVRPGLAGPSAVGVLSESPGFSRRLLGLGRGSGGAEGLMFGGGDKWPGRQNVLETRGSWQLLRWDDGLLFPRTSPNCTTHLLAQCVTCHMLMSAVSGTGHGDTTFCLAPMHRCPGECCGDILSPEGWGLPAVPSVCSVLRTEGNQVDVGLSCSAASHRSPEGHCPSWRPGTGLPHAALWSHECPALPAPGQTPTSRSGRQVAVGVA